MITKTANEKQLARVRREVREGRFTDLAQFNYQDYVKYDNVGIEEKEPVRAELENFLETIRTRGKGKGAPEVTGEDGLFERTLERGERGFFIS